MTYGRIQKRSMVVYVEVSESGGFLTEIGAVGDGGWSDAFSGREYVRAGEEVDRLVMLTPETLDATDEYAGFVARDGLVVVEVDESPDWEAV